MFLFRTWAVSQFRRRPLRSALTVFGIAIGIALSTGVGLLNESMLASFRDLMRGVGSRSDLTVTSPGRAGMLAETLDRVTGVPGVRAATPTVRVTGFLVDHPAETVVVLGVDALADKAFRATSSPAADTTDTLAFLNTPNAVLVPRSLAARDGLRTGDTLQVMAHGAPVKLLVRGIVDEEGIAKVYGGNVLVVDLYGSEDALGRGGAVDQIDVLVNAGTSVEAMQKSLSGALGPGFIVERAGRQRQAEQMLATIRKTTAILGLMALLVGMFLIYNTMGASVAQRRREIGILRAVGTTREEILAVVLGEAALLGFVGALAGVFGGYGLAKLLLADYAKGISNLYFQTHPETVVVTAALLARNLAVGTAAALCAAAIPAWRAASVSPLESLADTPAESHSRRRFRWAFGVGIAALAAETFLLVRPHARDDAQLGMVSTLVSFTALALLTPGLLVVLTAVLRPLFQKVFGLEARLGSDNLLRAMGRTAVTVAALMVGITLAVSIGGSFISLSVSIDDWISTGVTQDIMIRGSANLPGMSAVPLPEGMERDLQAVAGVRDVSVFRETPVTLAGGGTIQMIAMGTEVQMRHDRRRWFEGDPVDGRRRMAGRGYAVISENVATRYGLHPGDPLIFETPRGPARLMVAGVQVDYASDLGSAVVNRDDYVDLFGDHDLDAFNVWINPTADAAAVRERIRNRFADRQLFIQTNTEFRAEIHTAVRQLFGLSDVVQLLVIVIAMIGIVNTLLVSILDRTRELGLMRAIGFTREQLFRVILWEGALMGIIAGILGALSGSLFSLSIIHLVNRELVGWSTAYVFPSPVVIKGFAVAVASAVAAGWYPARRAARLNIVAAMEYR